MKYEDYLTEHERALLERRRSIALALEAGWNYERIRKELGTSSTTISQVKGMMRDRRN